jgi:hypothetical protein
MSQTSVGCNVRYLLYKLNFDNDEFGNYNLSVIKQRLFDQYLCGNDCRVVGETIREQCLVRDGVLSCDINNDDVICMLNQLCSE